VKNRIDAVFERLRASGQKAFMPFIAAGDPDMGTSAQILRECARRGADLIEFGIPYSDPVADGPAIQAAFTRALDAGATVQGAFSAVRELRRELDAPICAMLSFSVVHRIGPDAFMKRAAEAGIDGAIVPDLPVEEADDVIRAAEANGLNMVFLVAPTTTEQRLRLIVEHGKGFIYCVSVAGVTGTRDRLPDELVGRVRHLRDVTNLPIAVGFGISKPEQVRQVVSVADGAIVGSALVKAIEAACASNRDPVKAAGDCVEHLAAPTKEG